MNLVEIINSINQNRVELLSAKNPKNNYSFTPFVNPSEYEGSVTKLIGSRWKTFDNDKQEYLKDFIQQFLTSTYANSQPDLIKGFEEAQKLIYQQNGYGRVNDIYYRTNKKFIKFRILTDGEDIKTDEQLEMISFNRFGGKYIAIKTLEDFNNFYVQEFGEVI